MSEFYPKYRFFLDNTCAPGSTGCYPLEFINAEYTWQREDDFIFFRKLLDSPITFINDGSQSISDFTYLKDIYDNFKCCEIKFRVEKLCSGTWITDWEGYFTHNDVDWDFDKCTATVKLTSDDDYRCLLDNGNTEVNVLGVEDRITIQLSYTSVYDIYIDSTLDIDCLFTNPPGEPGYVLVFEDCTVPNSGTGRQVWIRERTFTQCVDGECTEPLQCGGPVWELISDTCGLDGQCEWVRAVGTSPPEILFADCVNGIPDPPPVPPGTDPEEYIIIFQDCEWFNPNLGVIIYYAAPCLINYTRVMTFSDVISYLVENTCPDIPGIRSNFLEINPLDDNPNFPYVPGKNYVITFNNSFFGETEDDNNYYSTLAIAQKSDIINPNSSNPATEGIMTFEELMEWLRIIFNIYWNIDDDGYLRIEHFVYYTSQQIYDLTVPPNAIYNEWLNQVSYNKQEMPKREVFKFAEAYYKDFVGVPIVYNSPCVNPKIKEKMYTVGDITTDINYIIDFPSSIDPHGFVFFLLDGILIRQATGKLTGTLQNNVELGWSNLHFNFHRHNRVLLSGVMNNVQQPFASAIKTRKQVTQSRIDCCYDFAPFRGYITTTQGNGEIEKATFYISQNRLLFDLVFDD